MENNKDFCQNCRLEYNEDKLFIRWDGKLFCVNCAPRSQKSMNPVASESSKYCYACGFGEISQYSGMEKIRKNKDNYWFHYRCLMRDLKWTK